MRVLLEFKGRRVDIKDPINIVQSNEETPAKLAKIIDQALIVVEGEGEDKCQNIE